MPTGRYSPYSPKVERTMQTGLKRQVQNMPFKQDGNYHGTGLLVRWAPMCGMVSAHGHKRDMNGV